MATLRDIRKRIVSVRNTQKITKAMKMVAAAKLRRAQLRLINARAYSDKMKSLINDMVVLMEKPPHGIFEPREEVKKAEFLIITSDRGLCGGFNGNLLRRTEATIRESQQRYESVRLAVIGRKGRDFFRSRHREPDQLISGIQESLPFDEALRMAEEIIQGYQEGRFDEFYLAYNYFKSAISQEIRIEKILPFAKPEKSDAGEALYVPEYLYEPSQTALLEKLVPRALATVIRRAYLESVAGEFGARMMAMDNATSNCVDMIGSLTLLMNRIRQAAITKELMDIVNGAEALK